MRHPMRGRRCAVAAAALLWARGAGAEPPLPTAPEAALRVEPRTIEVGMLYRGTTVRVEGTAPAGWRLALVLVGKEGRVELKQKGKVGNVLWMNVGRVAFERVPSLYLAFAGREGARPDRLAVPADLRLGLGFEGVEAQVLPPRADEATRRLFREFVRLKVQERLYSFGDLRTDETSDAAAPGRVSAEFSVPAGAPLGPYEIRMIGYRDGRAELLASERLTARRVGLALVISSMAERQGLVYGILSVAAAVAAGFLSGFLFAGSRKGH